MDAVHWVRSRQEERELAYWLSFVAYEQRDRSLNNRIYLLYLIAFFAGWLMMTLTLFASGGEVVLRLLNPAAPARSAVLLALLLVGGWAVIGFWQALRRSPIVFSEADEVLIGQTPVNRRWVALRWLPMPWFKSAVLFFLAAVVLGFSVAETAMPGEMAASRVLEYAGYGLRAGALVLPVHLALMALVWAAGAYRVRQDGERRALGWLALAACLAGFARLVMLVWSGPTPYLMPWSGLTGAGGWAALAGGAGAAALALGLLALAAGRFSLTRAAQETRDIEAVGTAARYGFADTQRKAERRLGVQRAPSRLPARQGAGALVWKDLLQSGRALHLGALGVWLRMGLIMLGFALLPDAGSRAVAAAIWVMQVGQASTLRLRGDLSRWAILRQLPIAHSRLLLAELGPAVALSVLVSWLGLAAGAVLFGAVLFGPADAAAPAIAGPVRALEFALLVPGLAACAAGMAAYNVLRRSRANLLLAGTAPDVSAGGTLLALLTAAVPVGAAYLVGGPVGAVMGGWIALGLGQAVFRVAAGAYRAIDAA